MTSLIDHYQQVIAKKEPELVSLINQMQAATHHTNYLLTEEQNRLLKATELNLDINRTMNNKKKLEAMTRRRNGRRQGRATQEQPAHNITTLKTGNTEEPREEQQRDTQQGTEVSDNNTVNTKQPQWQQVRYNNRKQNRQNFNNRPRRQYNNHQQSNYNRPRQLQQQRQNNNNNNIATSYPREHQPSLELHHRAMLDQLAQFIDRIPVQNYQQPYQGPERRQFDMSQQPRHNYRPETNLTYSEATRNVGFTPRQYGPPGPPTLANRRPPLLARQQNSQDFHKLGRPQPITTIS